MGPETMTVVSRGFAADGTVEAGLIGSDRLFRFYGGSRLRVTEEEQLFRNRITGRTAIVAEMTAFAASCCARFATIEEHAERIEKDHPGQRKGISDWEEALREAALAGLLVPANKVTAAIIQGIASRPSKPKIERIAIPTRDRPSMLQRALLALSGMLDRYGRTAEIMVMDDSRSPGMQSANRAVIAALPKSGRVAIRYGNRRSRRRFAEQLAQRAGIPTDLVSFGLLGKDGYAITIGAARNSLLLGSAASHVLFVDDDVVCRSTLIPNSSEQVTFEETADCFETWHLGGRSEARNFRSPGEDLLTQHERALGFDRSAALEAAYSNPAMISNASAALIERAMRGNGRVAVSSIGILGDAAIDNPICYFLQNPASLVRLTQSEDTYQRALEQRAVMRGPTNLVISDRGNCMSYCIGLDNTRLLPPFMPVQRAEELVFGWLVNRCIPGALFAAIPRAVLHDPPEVRTFKFAPGAAVGSAFTTGESLVAAIVSETIRGAEADDRLRSLATRIREVSRIGNYEFQEYLAAAMAPLFESVIQRLGRAQQQLAASPGPWTHAITQFKDQYIRALDKRVFTAPSDLPRLNEAERSDTQLRSLLEQFAGLLEAWPVLFEACNKAGHLDTPLFTELD